ncbi:MAG TPA: glycoside hydrolase family 3 protein [Acidimicrobiales bacterium]
MTDAAARIAKLVADLTLDEKAALTAGVDLWTTAAVPRLGIPPVRVTDGPNGARGTVMGPAGPTATCLPSGSALGATWSTETVAEVGAVIGAEARAKGARVLLAPTVNIHRSPLAGRNFECYSEDPLLSGRLAAAYIRGAQGEGVATTVKHFVGNDSETERYTMSSDIDERALREIYLRPFELAVREGGSLGVMTSYNRVNGRWCTEQPELLEGILRDEWGFDGFVVTDWFGVTGTAASAEAGVDLEMPGPGRAFGPALADAVRAGSVDEALVDAQVTRLLTVLDRIGALDDPGPGEDRAVDDPEHAAVARRAAAEAMVLLANDGLLPLDRTTLGTVAVIGPNAKRPAIMGGGSASVRAPRVVSPLDALRAALGDGVTLVHEPGCSNRKTAAALGAEDAEAPGHGRPGLAVDWFAHPDLAGDPVHHSHMPVADLVSLQPPVPGLVAGGWSLRAHTVVTPAVSGTHRVTLVQAGRTRVIVGGTTVLDGFADPPPRGSAMFGMGSVEVAAAVDLEAGTPVDVTVEFSTRAGREHGGLRIGWEAPDPPDQLERAVAAAAAADAVVLVVGTSGEWESEGHDRTTMDLPGRQDALVEAVLAANPATVVVVNAASPVTMDWAPSARALVQAWFGGQELGPALAGVLLGDSEPAGRLPTTLPVRLEHNPSYGNFPGEAGHVRYGEGVLVGYRWYEARGLPVRFPFGHGGSYTTWELGPPTPEAAELAPGGTVVVRVPVTNTGDRRGAQVVQCYVAPPAARVVRPPQELAAFAKVWLDPGETDTIELVLDERAFAYWSPSFPEREELAARGSQVPMSGAVRDGDGPGWRVDPGRYELRIGTSSADIAHVLAVEVTAG